MELEAPSSLTAARPQNEEYRDNSPEGDEDTQGVDEAVRAEAATLLARGLHQREALEEKDGEDAGH